MKLNSYQKKLLLVVFGLTAIGIIFMGVVISRNQNNLKKQAIHAGIELEFKNDEIEEVEYGTKVSVLDFVKSYKGEMESPFLDTKVMGIQDLKFKITADRYKETFIKRIKVVDSYAPELHCPYEDNIYLLLGEENPIDLNQITAKDPIEGAVPIQVQGSVDTSRIGRYVLYISAKDSNNNRTEKKIIVNVRAPEEEREHDYAIGEALDAYIPVDEHTIQARGLTIHVDEGIDQETILHYVKQINVCPQFLIECIDEVSIETKENMKNNYDVVIGDKYTTVGHTQRADGETHIALNGSQTDKNNTFLHEACHAYDFLYAISSADEFNEIYDEEKRGVEKRERENVYEFFAYMYHLYLEEGPDALKKVCPKTCEYFKEYQI